jgi:RES domain
VEFNPSPAGNARFSPLVNAAGAVIPTLYAGTTLDCALMETVFHDVPFVAGPKIWSKATHAAGKVYSQLILDRNVKGGVKPSQWGGVRIGHWIAV